MSDMVKVNVDLEEGWRFWFNMEEKQITPSFVSRHGYTLEVQRELVDRFERVSQEYFKVQAEIEQLYRVQEGIGPWTEPPVPEHRVL